MKAVFPGSFDPITHGHIDILLRTMKLFDEIHILVGFTPKKAGLFTSEEKVQMIETVFPDQIKTGKFKVCSWTGMTVDYCKQKGVEFIVRGVRSSSDFEYEVNMSEINRHLNASVQTLFIPAHPHQRWVSSSAVREIASVGGDISSFVPKEILSMIHKKFTERKP
jgi:pantetheine-phosphate adenylyltransferase